MPAARINGVELYYELTGSGEPLVLVHGWRGHSASERPAGQGSVFEDVDDLAGLIDELGLAPAHVAGNSAGAAIVLDALAALWQTGAVDQRDRERPLLRTSGGHSGRAPAAIRAHHD